MKVFDDAAITLAGRPLRLRLWGDRKSNTAPSPTRAHRDVAWSPRMRNPQPFVEALARPPTGSWDGVIRLVST